MVVFTRSNCGCYADGANGEKLRRAVLYDLLTQIEEATMDNPTLHPAADGAYALKVKLNGDALEDYSEEDATIELLNDYTEAGVFFAMVDGDLMLLFNDEVS